MDKEIYGINEAVFLLKEGNKLKDIPSSVIILKKGRGYIYSLLSSYSLKMDEFVNLYKESKFVIFVDDEEGIDAKKDEEYYSYKHK